ncbi:MAG: hypothetical protein SOU27_03550 [Sodaliphilus sp.]|nr:hypothetical protein [Sodaliphilus sp.]
MPAQGGAGAKTSVTMLPTFAAGNKLKILNNKHKTPQSLSPLKSFE